MQPPTSKDTSPLPYDTGFTSQVDSGIASTLAEPKQTLADVQSTIEQAIKDCISSCKGVVSECSTCVNDAIVSSIIQSATFLQSLGSTLQDAIINLLGTAYGYAATVGISMPPGYTIPPSQVLNEVQFYGKPPTPAPTPGGSTISPGNVNPSSIPPGPYGQPPIPGSTGLPPQPVQPGVPPYPTQPPGTLTPPYTLPPPTPPGGGISTSTIGQPMPSPGGGTSTGVPPGQTIPPPIYPPTFPPYQTQPPTLQFPPTQVYNGPGTVQPPGIPGTSIGPLPPVQTSIAPIGPVVFPPIGGIPLPPTTVTSGCPPQGIGSVVNCPPVQNSISCPPPNITINVSPANVALTATLSSESISNAVATAAGQPPTDVSGTPPQKLQPVDMNGGCPDGNDVEWLWRECSREYEQEVATFAGIEGLEYFDASNQQEIVYKYPPMTYEPEITEWPELDQQLLDDLVAG